ncbi:MAG: cyclic pyranopterin monophosphate synthase MoaC [Syntrophobacterales bacterium]|nr:MAG: cyclic pyranopterin monophosphate synthase MoaC [Syntrophobacterales bacterium]
MKKKNDLTHFDEGGKARMVDVSHKDATLREAIAHGSISMNRETFRMIMDRRIAKGNVLGVARVAGIMGAKRTADLIPMCHPLNITNVEIEFFLSQGENKIEIEARVKTSGQTGVEMEAFMAVCMAALTIYDMCKAVDRGMVISDIHLVEKKGGKSGTFRWKGEKEDAHKG